MFQVASEHNIDVCADSVSEFIRKCMGDIVPTVTIKTYSNQKLWIDGGIRAKLKARSIAFNQRGLGICLNTNSVVIPSARQSNKAIKSSEMPVQGQGGVAIQRLRYKTYVAGSTGNHRLKK